MKNLLIVSSFVLATWQLSIAQPGFNQSYDFGLSINQFKTILVDNDTIVLAGYASSPDSPFAKSALVGRLDSNGQLLGYALFKDSLNDYLDVGEKLIRTADGGYAFTSAILFRKSDALYKFNKSLELESIFEFSDTVNLAVFYKDLIELEDGYLLAGYITRPNHKRDGFVRRINNEGNTIWFKYYGGSVQDELILDMSRFDDSSFALCGTTGVNFQNIEEINSKIWIINQEGIVLKTWTSPDSLNIPGIFLLVPNIDKGLIGFAWTFSGYNAWGDEIQQPTVIRLDADLEFKWSKRFGPAHSSFSIWHDLQPTPDGNFIGVGRIAPYDLSDLNAHLYGWLYKFSPEGDSIWARADLSEVPYTGGIDDNTFGGVGFFSSGSVVAGGNSYINGQFYGWIIKVTPDGCLDTLFCQPLSGHIEPQTVTPLQVYPNPTIGLVELDGFLPSNHPQQGHVLDVTGQIVAVFKVEVGRSEVSLSLANLPLGLYIVTLTNHSGQQQRVKVVRQ